ncbi:MAG: tRNA 4-thiouridine(8) synthase ThiI [Acidobacteria bacterium]|nr:tRNA 4-thiouridine(8) synthase ThiI [Acidobacteriota bacterium]
MTENYNFGIEVERLKRAIIIHYHEINLKGNNRGWFEAHLQNHIPSCLKGLKYHKVRKISGRLIVELAQDSPIEALEQRLAMVFGIANFVVAWEVPAEMDAIQSGLDYLIAQGDFQSFKMESRRGTKNFPLNSQQLNEQLGAYVQQRTGADVRLANPDRTFFVEIVDNRAFLYFNKIPGAGGLPSGTGGKVACLLSGGIDSPVAAYRLMRRGCRVLFVHFHSFPHTSAESQDKVRNILQVLSRFQLQSRLFMVPFADVQKEIVAYAPPPLRVILYRRFMVRIAQTIAEKEKAKALVTGDSLGQVASQTLENIQTISSICTMPIFRPLIGSDKEEIIQIARKIGTYDISIQADQDCCSLFVPRHPETMARLQQAEEAEIGLDVPGLVRSCLDSATRESIAPDFLTVQPND